MQWLYQKFIIFEHKIVFFFSVVLSFFFLFEDKFRRKI